MYSITTDYVKSTGNPFPYLRRIAEAGFSHVHWCHHWNTDYHYSEDEIKQIAKRFKTYDLKLNDLHSTEGTNHDWLSTSEDQRKIGLALVKNRVHMASYLGSDVIIQHIPAEPQGDEEKRMFWDQVHKSMKELEPYVKNFGIRIAFENLIENFNTLDKLFATYDKNYIGLCFDTGHANLVPGALERLEPYKDRLISIHLHDNDGNDDQHKLPFTGNIDWNQVIRFIAHSPYRKCINLEVLLKQTNIDDETIFLHRAYECGKGISKMIAEYREKDFL